MNNERRALPEGWEWKRLGDVATVGAGNSAPQGDRYFTDGKYPFVRTQDVGREKATICLVKTKDDINDFAVKDFNLKLWPAKTLLIPKSGESTFLNHRALLGKPSYVSSHLATVMPSNGLMPEYLFFWSLILDSKKLTHDINYPSLRLSELESAKIPLPPLPTQRRIVSILEKAEETKRLRAQADELTNRLLQSVFLEMFGDPVRNPKGWEKVRLNDVCEKIQDETHFSPQDQTGEVPYVTAKNIRPWGIDLTDVTYVTREFHEEIYRRCDPKKGDVIYIKDGVTAGLAKVNSLDFEFSMLSSIAMIRPKSSYLNSYYLEYYLNYPATYKRIMERKSGSAITRLILREIKDINIHLPPLPLQQEFARIVEKIESMRQSQNQSKQQIENLFSALMQKAFRGNWIKVYMYKEIHKRK